MNDAPTYQCYLGTVGWDHPGWQGPFYPEDLPTEWRLGFYNNTFDCVYLPYAQWSGADPDEIRRWMDETHDRFRFVLESGGPALSESDRERIEKFNGKLGWVDDAREKPGYSTMQGHSAMLWVDISPDLKQLAQTIQSHISKGQIVYLICRFPDLPTLEQLRTLRDVLGL